jgi:hypothetical protein
VAAARGDRTAARARHGGGGAVGKGQDRTTTDRRAEITKPRSRGGWGRGYGS